MILITGGAGFIGSTIARQLLDKNYNVTVLDNLSRKGVKNNLKRIPEAKFLKGDVRYFHLLEDYNIIIHTAANAGIPFSIENPIEDFSINALGTLKILEYARKHDSAVIYCSTNKVYSPDLFKDEIILQDNRYDWICMKGFPPDYRWKQRTGGDWHSPYGVSKLTGDLYCQEYASTYGLDVIINRMSCIYGTHQYGEEEQGWIVWFIKANLTEQSITIYGDGKQVRDVLFGEDCAKLYCMQVEDVKKWKGVWSVGGGPDNTLSLLEAIELIKKVTGKDFKKITYTDWRLADQKVFITNISELEKMGWKPETNPEQGVKKIVEWFNEN